MHALIEPIVIVVWLVLERGLSRESDAPARRGRFILLAALPFVVLLEVVNEIVMGRHGMVYSGTLLAFPGYRFPLAIPFAGALFVWCLDRFATRATGSLSLPRLGLGLLSSWGIEALARAVDYWHPGEAATVGLFEPSVPVFYAAFALPALVVGRMMSRYGSSERAPEDVAACRVGGALVVAGAGWAIVSVCLFRVLAFDVSSPSFYVLFSGLGIPLGALLARGAAADDEDRLFWSSLKLLVVVTAGLPFLCLLVTAGPDLLDEVVRTGSVRGSTVALHLAVKTVVTLPFFIAWGYAEFAGYRVALRRPGVRGGFYALFVLALVLGSLVGTGAVSAVGWTWTLALAPVCAVLSGEIFGAPPEGGHGVRPWAVVLVLVLLVGGVGDARLARSFMPDRRQHLPNVLSGHHVLTGAPVPGATARVLAQTWGDVTHVSLVAWDDEAGSTLLGFYDGVFIWSAASEREGVFGPVAFRSGILPRRPRVLVVGSGGGRQVRAALEDGAAQVTAVELVGDVFSLVSASGMSGTVGGYRDPRVRCVAGDGRSFAERDDGLFDLIVLPHTESAAFSLRTLFEPGQSLHTLEGFAALRRRLAPGGRLVVIKGIDVGERLFGAVVRTLEAAGFRWEGWVQRGAGNPFFKGRHGFLVVAGTEGMDDGQFSDGVQTLLRRDGFVPTGTAVAGPVMRDEGPWLDGTVGLYLEATTVWQIMAAVFGLGLVGLGVLVGRHRSDGFCLGSVAAVLVGVNAVVVQTAVVYWFLRGLTSSLRAFYVGTAVFLLMWAWSAMGAASPRCRWVLMPVGVVVVLAGGEASGSWVRLVGLLIIALASGVCFPSLVLRRADRVFDVVVADALGGFVGGMICIWLPVVAGLRAFLWLVPLVATVTVIVTAVAVGSGTSHD